jgi:hypothetical protein
LIRWSPAGASVAAGYAITAGWLAHGDGLGLASFVVALPWSLATLLLPDWVAYTRAWEAFALPAAVALNAALLYAACGGWRQR